MLYNTDPLLGPELLCVLRGMGHGDEIAIVDANYPAISDARRLIRMDGLSATDIVSAIITVLPVDSYVDHPVHTMQVVDASDEVPAVVTEFLRIVSSGPGGSYKCESLERFEFYQRVRDAFAVIATGERRLYGNILIKKGVIASDSA